MAREMVKWAKRTMVSHTVVSSILLAGNHSLRVEEGPVSACLYVVDCAGLEIDVNGTRDIFARTSLGEEG